MKELFNKLINDLKQIDKENLTEQEREAKKLLARKEYIKELYNGKR